LLAGASIIIPGGNRLDFPDPIFFNHAINDCVLGLLPNVIFTFTQTGSESYESIATFSAQSSPIYCDFIKISLVKFSVGITGIVCMT
jgi:hypothetical protein